MISLLQTILDFIVSIGHFLINSITSLFTLISHIPTYSDFLITSVSYLPAMVLPFAVASISIYIVLFVIGR